MRKSSVSKFICTVVKTVITCKIITGEDENWNRTRGENICGWILKKKMKKLDMCVYIIQNSTSIIIKQLFISISLNEQNDIFHRK